MLSLLSNKYTYIFAALTLLFLYSTYQSNLIESYKEDIKAKDLKIIESKDNFDKAVNAYEQTILIEKEFAKEDGIVKAKKEDIFNQNILLQTAISKVEKKEKIQTAIPLKGETYVPTKHCSDFTFISF